MMYWKNCFICDKLFHTKLPHKKTCSPKCSKELNRRRASKYYHDVEKYKEYCRESVSERELENFKRNNEIYYRTKGTCYHV